MEKLVIINFSKDLLHQRTNSYIRRKAMSL